MEVITKNRQAYFDYEILGEVEAGIKLQGTEIKSVRNHNVSIEGAYAQIIDGEAWLIGSYIEEYEFGTTNNHDPSRRRKLLMHRSEIDHFDKKLSEKGLTLIPLKVGIIRGNAKVLIGLARGKKSHDKRHSLREKEDIKEMKKYE